LNEPMLKTGSAAISTAEFFARARTRLNFNVPPGLVDPNIIPESGDRGTERMLEIIARERPIRPAAVLIPVVDHPEPTVLLTQRSAHLNDHAGQISFPGGKIDATDASPLDAALREAYEEVGLRREFIEPMHHDMTGSLVAPNRIGGPKARHPSVPPFRRRPKAASPRVRKSS